MRKMIEPDLNEIGFDGTYPAWTSEALWLFMDTIPKCSGRLDLSDKDDKLYMLIREKLERLIGEFMETEGCPKCKEIVCICEPMIEEDRFVQTPPVSDVRIEASGVSPEEFKSIFNDGIKLVAEMTPEAIQDRIRELTAAITKLKITLYAAQSLLADKEAKLTRAERAALRERDRKFKVKAEAPKAYPKPVMDKTEKLIQNLMKNGMTREQAEALIKSSGM